MKRGVSPLIATVLILGITIVVSVLVMQWGKNWTTALTSSTDIASKKEIVCNTEAHLLLDACEDSENTVVTSSNTGGTVMSVIVSVCETTGCVTSSYMELDPGESNIYTAEFDNAIKVTSSFNFTSSMGEVTCQGPILNEIRGYC